jgi:GntR family transcriptional regulator
MAPAATRSPAAIYHQSVSLHHQVERLLRTKLEAGEWGPGEQIPTEMALVDRLGVSRTTLREALRALTRDGLIVRHRRRGTFVQEASRAGPSRATITNLLLGYTMNVRVVRVGTVPAPGHVGTFLGVPRSHPVRRFVRVHIVEGSPLAAVVNYMRDELGRRVRLRDLSRVSMLEVLRDKLAVDLGSVHQQIEARMPDDEIAPLLEIDLTQPVLLVRQHLSDRHKEPVQLAETYFRADRYRYETWMCEVSRRRAEPEES